MLLCATWYQLYNLNYVKNTHGEMLLLEKLQASFNSNVTKSNTTSRVLFMLFKSYEWSHIAQSLPFFLRQLNDSEILISAGKRYPLMELVLISIPKSSICFSMWGLPVFNAKINFYTPFYELNVCIYIYIYIVCLPYSRRLHSNFRGVFRFLWKAKAKHILERGMRKYE